MGPNIEPSYIVRAMQIMPVRSMTRTGFRLGDE